MRDFKKAIINTIIIVLIIILVSAPLLFCVHNYDWQLRKELAGSLDFLIVGASQGQCALYTREIDNGIGCNSYNLCYDDLRNPSKSYLLRKELLRNHIKTVVLELSYDTLQLSEMSEYTDANCFSILRMDSPSDRISFFINNISINDKFLVYANLMILGFKNILNLQNNNELIYQKGSRLLPSDDHRLADNEIVTSYNSINYTISSFNESTINGFTDLIRICQDYNTRIIVTVVPVSDNYLWRYDNLDEFNEWAKKYCADNNVEYYDFNLLKNRYTLLSDLDCYSTDEHHMSEKGSKIFSNVFANIIKDVSNGKDVSDEFYSTYVEMKQDSPYMSAYMASQTP